MYNLDATIYVDLKHVLECIDLVNIFYKLNVMTISRAIMQQQHQIIQHYAKLWFTNLTTMCEHTN